MANPQISQEGDLKEGWIGSGISLLDVGQRQLSRELKVFSGKEMDITSLDKVWSRLAKFWGHIRDPPVVLAEKRW